METTVKQRLIDFIKFKGISIRAFEQSIEVSNGFVNNISKSIGANKMQRILSVYPELNASWLLTGEGEMLNADTKPAGLPKNAIPFYGDLPVSGGRVIQYPDIFKQLPTGFINIPQSQGAEGFFPVIGMSMLPTIEEGEIVGVCHIDGYETVNADRVYMIVTKDDERMIKRILKYDKATNTLTLGSDNPNYPNTELDAALIADVYKVVCHMRIDTL